MRKTKRTKKIRGKWLRLSEEKNALDYLEKAYWFIRQTDKNIIAWKWVSIALSSALYAFAVCAVKGTDPARVTSKDRKGNEKLIGFWEVLRRCQDPKWIRGLVGSRPLILNASQKDSIERLKNQLRNTFEHYIPTGLSIEIHGAPRIAIDVLDVIQFLAIDVHCFAHFNESQKRKIKSMIFQSKLILKRSKLYRELENVK